MFHGQSVDKKLDRILDDLDSKRGLKIGQKSVPLRDPEPAGSPLILETRYQSKRDQPTVMPFKPCTESPFPASSQGCEFICKGGALHEQGRKCARMDSPKLSNRAIHLNYPQG